jgi:hypothetical protein
MDMQSGRTSFNQLCIALQHRSWNKGKAVTPTEEKLMKVFYNHVWEEPNDDPTILKMQVSFI